MSSEDVKGFTQEEAVINARLVEVVNRARALPPTHPADLAEIMHHIHGIQHVLGMRILRREHPEIFVTIVPKPPDISPAKEEKPPRKGMGVRKK